MVLLVDPDTCRVWVGVCGDVELGECVDDCGLEESDVFVDSQARRVEIDDWVADELAWAVVRDIAASVGLVELHALGFEQ